ncbi:MAG: VCBS repeat-containing protein [Saprospiraceae bacterium]|nr:VCBS repeat-containing protein [Saprospiraceae bacterium]
MADINNDGQLDAFVCNDIGKSVAYRNEGNGNLIADNNLIETSPLAGNYAAIWSDFNNDGHADLYISKCKADAQAGDPVRTNLLYINNGDNTFDEKGRIAGVDDNAQSWTSVVEDFDNDGDMDIFVVNHDQKNKLYRNDGHAIFTEVIENSGINPYDLGGFEAIGGDFNNDGFVDIMSDLSKQLYLGNGDLTFTAQNLPFTPSALGDFDADGFLDITTKSQLWINDKNGHRYLKLHLKGIESNSNGIGSRIEIYGTWGKQIRELRSGQSYSPMNTLDVHFGLGDATIIDSLIINWPSGIQTRLLNLNVDSNYVIVESPCLLESLQLESPKQIMLCPGEKAKVTAPNGYLLYEWSNGDTTQILETAVSGFYAAVYQDALGCRGITDLVQIIVVEELTPEIQIVSDNYPKCKGEEIVLHSTAGDLSKWSDGSENKAEISVREPGTYHVTIDSVCGIGQINSAPIQIDFFDVSPPKLLTINKIDSQTFDVQMEGNSCNWYDADGTFLFEGCQKRLSNITTDTLFYVSDKQNFVGPLLSAGKLDTLGYKIIFTQPRKMYFTAWSPFYLETVDIYVNNNTSVSERTISLLDKNNNMVSSVKVNLNLGKNKVFLKFRIDVGQYSLVCDRTDQLMNVGGMDYPYPIASFGQIDSSSVSPNFYPYFYNWQVRQDDTECNSSLTTVSILASSTQDLETETGIIIFPMPADDKIFLKSAIDLQQTNCIFYTMDGHIIKNITLGSSQELNTQDLSRGSYLLKNHNTKTNLYKETCYSQIKYSKITNIKN